MKGAYRGLAERIRGETSDLSRMADKAVRVWAKCQEQTEGQDIYLDSVTLNLHGIYSGIERIFELISKYVDQTARSGAMWHRELLKQMSMDIIGVRPAVISEGTFGTLDELRRFRHLVRNVYTFNLVPEKVEPLVTALSFSWPLLKKELLAFADFLEEMAEEAKR